LGQRFFVLLHPALIVVTVFKLSLAGPIQLPGRDPSGFALRMTGKGPAGLPEEILRALPSG